MFWESRGIRDKKGDLIKCLKNIYFFYCCLRQIYCVI